MGKVGTLEYAESFLSYFSRYAQSDPLFEPELKTATRVVELMRLEPASHERLAEIAHAMRAIDQVSHYDGSGWHGFRTAVHSWLAERGHRP